MLSTSEETVIALMDYFWFQHGVFAPKPESESPIIPQEEQQVEKPKLNRVATRMRKSHSDQFLSSQDSLSDDKDSSPTSVLTPQLQTILSGKETGDFTDSVQPEQVPQRKVSVEVKKKNNKKRRSSSSRSLSELEVEELKGFMDLGFVFSDQDKDSKKLVSMIPGLQRLGKEEQQDEESDENALMVVSRPYLSEAWERFEEEERKRNLKKMELRIPAFGNEMELKNHLRCWAHSVASAVR